MSDRRDVVVVGGGPAGLSTARIAAKNGLDVVVLERQSKIGQKIQCAEGVTNRIMGIDPEIALLKEHISTPISIMKIFMPNGTMLDMGRRKPHAEGYIIDRTAYDQFLAKKAENHGVEIRTNAMVTAPITKNGRVQGVSVRDRTSNEEYNVYGKVIVASDGVSSALAKRVGLPVRMNENEFGLAVESRYANISVDPHAIEIYFLKECSLNGYSWVFPKSSTSANIGVGITDRVVRQKGLNVHNLLDDFVKRRFYGQDPKPFLRMNGVIPAAICKTLVAPGIALTGDAARQASPISGAGVENAIRSGILLGQTIADGGFSTTNLKRYESEYLRTIGRKMQVFMYARKVLELIYDISPNLIWWGADIIETLFDFQKSFIDLTGGREAEPIVSTGTGEVMAKMIKKVI